MAYTLTDGTGYIRILDANGKERNILKSHVADVIRTKNNTVAILINSEHRDGYGTDSFELAPTSGVSTVDLRNTIIGYLQGNTIVQDVNLIEVLGTATAVGSGVMNAGTQRIAVATDSPDVVVLEDMLKQLEALEGGFGTLIGKQSGGDFDTVWLSYAASDTIINCTNMPSAHAALLAEDIEKIVRIATADGARTEYIPGDGTDGTFIITVDPAGAPTYAITIADSGTTLTGDDFVVYTNIRKDATASAGGAGGGNNTYSTEQKDFTAVFASGTTILVTYLNSELLLNPLALNNFANGVLKLYDLDATEVKTIQLDKPGWTPSATGGTLDISACADTFTIAAGDTISLTVIGTDKTFEQSLNATRIFGGITDWIPDEMKYFSPYNFNAAWATDSTLTLSAIPVAVVSHKSVFGVRVTDSDGYITEYINGRAGYTFEYAGGTLTCKREGVAYDIFDTTDLEHNVLIIGDLRGYDASADSQKVLVQNPDYANYTSVELLIDESNLGIDGTYTAHAAPTLVFEDDSETYTPEDVAEGYTIYNVTDGTSGIIDVDSNPNGYSGDYVGDGGAGYDSNAAGADATCISHAALGANWDAGDVASIPECKRFEINMEGYRFMSIDVFMDSQDANNSCYCKIYASDDDTADLTDDTRWKDVSSDVFGAAQLSADGIGGGARTWYQGIFFIDASTIAERFMIKIVAENDDGTQDNEFEIRIKKGY